MASNPLQVKIGQVKFKNPILVASGTYGYAKEFERFYDVKVLGGIVTKTITLKPRLGNPPQRVVETPSGMLNAIGLQNVGVVKFVQDKLPYLRSLKIPIIVSVMGYSIEEFKDVVKALDKQKGIHGYELNLSCPNVSYGTRQAQRNSRSPVDDTKIETTKKMFAHDADMIRDVVKKIRKITTKLVIAKLGPDVSNIGQMANAAERGGADAISLINTFMAMAIDIKSRTPVLKNVTGGLSGPCIRPIAVRMVWDAYKAVNVPVIGMGGISDINDILEFFIAGASLVQIGTMNFVNPHICPRMIRGVNSYFKTHKIKSMKHITGTLRV